MKKFLGFLLSLSLIIGIGAATITTTGCSKKEGDDKAKDAEEKDGGEKKKDAAE